MRVPPPVVALVTAAGMWGVARPVPSLGSSPVRQLLMPLVLVSLALGLEAASIAPFVRARTTINPMRPERSDALVIAGAYRFTRNPMYLGLLLLLAAWGLRLGTAWTLLALPAVAAYITRFQIVPEERALAARFGEAYAAYQARVRRWI